MDDAQLQAHANSFYYEQAIGPQAEYYLARFDTFERAGDQWVASWNWPAFFFSSAWFAYRRMSGYSLLNFFLPVLLVLMLLVMNQSGVQLLLVAGYLLLTFVAIPKYANSLYYRHLKARIARVATSEDDEKTRRLLRPPSIKSVFEALLTAVLIFGMPLLILAAIPWYADYTPRAKVAESISLTVSLKNTITGFYREHQRLPAPHEVETFRIDSGKYAKSIAYDAEKRMIVVTMGGHFNEKRFAMHAEVTDGMISWTCRTIDLEPKYLPSACR